MENFKTEKMLEWAIRMTNILEDIKIKIPKGGVLTK